MEKKISFLVLIALAVFLPQNIKASCSDAEIVRLQKLANNVNVNYTYYEKSQKFNIAITNLKSDLILKDIYANKTYNTNEEVIIKNENSGVHKYYIYAKNKDCTKDLLTTKYIELPYYNYFYNMDICKDINNYRYCKKWVNSSINEAFYTKKIYDYLNGINNKKIEEEKNDSNNQLLKKVCEIYLNYYYIIIPLFIFVMCISIYIMNKKEKIV